MTTQTCVFADSARPLPTRDDACAAARRVNRGRRDKRRVVPVRCPCCAQYFLSVTSRDLRWARQRRRRRARGRGA